ncbi:hypothetical protein D3C75_1220660 [compost metagenome]
MSASFFSSVLTSESEALSEKTRWMEWASSRHIVLTIAGPGRAGALSHSFQMSPSCSSALAKLAERRQ